MRMTFAACLIALVCAAPLCAADLGAPSLSPPLASARFFDPDRLLTTAGVRYAATDLLTLEPELGLGYRELARDLAGGLEESTQQLHAQAGGRISLSQTLYLSAAAKLQVLTVESVGSIGGQERNTRYGYDITRPFRSALTWTGQVGLRLSRRTDLNVYYDQSPITGWFPGGRQNEERVGTRIIWKFW